MEELEQEMDEKIEEIAEDLSVPGVIKKVKRLAKWFHKSNIAADDLREAENLKLLQSVETRWNSTYKMLKRFDQLSTSVNTILLSVPNSPPTLCAEEKYLIAEILPMLEVFNDVTERFSSESLITISTLLSEIRFINHSLESIDVKKLSKEAQKFRNALLVQMKTRFGKTEQEDIAAISAMLDPRFKKTFFSDIVNAAKGKLSFKL